MSNKTHPLLHIAVPPRLPAPSALPSRVCALTAPFKTERGLWMANPHTQEGCDISDTESVYCEDSISNYIPDSSFTSLQSAHIPYDSSGNICDSSDADIFALLAKVENALESNPTQYITNAAELTTVDVDGCDKLLAVVTEALGSTDIATAYSDASHQFNVLRSPKHPGRTPSKSDAGEAFITTQNYNASHEISQRDSTAEPRPLSNNFLQHNISNEYAKVPTHGKSTGSIRPPPSVYTVPKIEYDSFWTKGDDDTFIEEVVGPVMAKYAALSKLERK
ncbi:hypothetical protein HDU84_008642 [Entophlyctis sp. JEL0112]|nr:hypothetical protein HDU84_008642 [Entophlyctis sp. JEL0112]